jgi:hypothetical protein
LSRRQDREEHEEEEVPTQGHPKAFHILGRPNPHQNPVGKREKTHRAIERIKMTGWIINIPILLV